MSPAALARTFTDLCATLSRIEQQQRVFVCSRSFKDGRQTIRVLVGGEYYDCNEHDLRYLRAGTTPAELELEPQP